VKQVLVKFVTYPSEGLRLYSWARFEPTMGTLLAPWRGSRPGFFALCELSASLAPVYRFGKGQFY
jgi:hypothetical protein